MSEKIKSFHWFLFSWAQSGKLDFMEYALGQSTAYHKKNYVSYQ